MFCGTQVSLLHLITDASVKMAIGDRFFIDVSFTCVDRGTDKLFSGTWVSLFRDRGSIRRTWEGRGIKL